MKAFGGLIQSSLIIMTFLIVGCVQSKPSGSSFNKGAVDRAVAQKVQADDVTSNLSAPDAQKRMEEILEGTLVNMMENNLQLIKATIGDREIDYNGQVFYGLETELTAALEYMNENGVGQDYKIRDILEAEGISVANLKKGQISMDSVDSTMELTSQFLEKGFDIFASEDSTDTADTGIALRTYPVTRSQVQWAARRGPLPVNCRDVGRAETAAAVTGGVCGGAALACAVGALPTLGAACIGLAACGAAAGVTGAGAAAAKAQGGC